MYELDYAKMGARIRQFRKAKGWSQGKLAKKCGISLNFMGNIERGTRRMSMDTFAGLCNALGTDADTLLFGIAKYAETPVRRMWGQAGMQDGEEPQEEEGGKEDRMDGAGREEGRMDGAGREEGRMGGAGKEDETYAIYVQIMKSVADILQGGGSGMNPSKENKMRSEKKHRKVHNEL